MFAFSQQLYNVFEASINISLAKYSQWL